MSLPVITILLPVYNGERFLRESIESILNQTFRSYELLLLDDGSSDETPRIAAQYEVTDSRVKHVRLARLGIAGALNYGLNLAQGDLVARMDADDIAMPNRLERQYQYMMDNPDVAVLGSYAEMIGASGRVIGISTAGPRTIEEFKAQRDSTSIIFCHPTVMFRRVVILRAGGYSEDYLHAEDYELWNRLASAHLMLTLPESLLKYRVHDESTGTASMRKQAESTARAHLNILRSRSGCEPLSEQAFQELQARRPLLVRLQEALRLYSRWAYRRSGAKLAEGNPAGFGWLLLSVATAPSVPFSRLLRQRIAPMGVPKITRWFKR